MCDFKVGDEVVCVHAKDEPSVPGNRGVSPVVGLSEGATYTVAEVGDFFTEGMILVRLNEVQNADPGGKDWGYFPWRFRKVQRRNSRLTLEAFFMVPGGFEEPKRAPAKTPERV